MGRSQKLNQVEILKLVRISEMYSSFLCSTNFRLKLNRTWSNTETKLGGGLKIGQNIRNVL